MAVPFSNTKLRVPRGFQNLLEGLAREVLRSQPTNLYAFGAQYFENMLKTREETGMDPAEHGAKMEDRFYNNKAFTHPEIDPSNPQQQEAALTIQTKYRQHAAKQEVESIREDKAATKIQAGFRGYQDRQKIKNMKTDESHDIANDHPDIDLNDPEVESAAIKIQAGFKGYKTRKELNSAAMPVKLHKQTPSVLKQTEGAGNDLDRAAAKIQAGYRGMKTRKGIKASREANLIDQGDDLTENTSEEAIDIDLKDPDVEKAAIKIQAGFKGLKTRKALRANQKKAEVPMTEDEVVVHQEEPQAEESTVEEPMAMEENQEQQLDEKIEDSGMPADEEITTELQDNGEISESNQIPEDEGMPAEEADDVMPEEGDLEGEHQEDEAPEPDDNN